MSWEGYAVTIALLLGMLALGLEGDPARRSIAILLLIAAYAALVCLTWGDPDAEVRRSWRETLFNWQTLAWLAFLLVLAATMIAAGYQGSAGGHHGPAPFSQAGARLFH